MKKKLILFLAAVVLCAGAMHLDAHAMKVSKKKKTIYVKTGKTVKLKIKGFKRLPLWKSKNRRVVKPLKRGYIQTLAPGKTTIAAKAGKKKFRVKVVVMAMSRKSLYLKAGMKTKIGVIKGGGKVKWKSSNKKVAKVSRGVIKAKGPGTTYIIAKAHDRYFRCKVTVPDVKISKASLVASPPDPAGLKAYKSKAAIKVKNCIGTPIFTSNNPELATVDSSGTVTAIKGGTAVISVNAGGLVYDFKVKISSRPVDIYLSHLKKYSKYVKAHGKYFKRSDSPVESFQEAKMLVSKSKKVSVNCRAHCTWAFRDMGIYPYKVYAKDGTFKSKYKGSMTTYLTRITSGGPIGKQFHDAVDAGLLKPGDICAFKGRTHTFTYSGEGYKCYDGGSIVQMKGYSNIGFLMDYGSVNYYDDKVIGEVLRWNY